MWKGLYYFCIFIFKYQQAVKILPSAIDTFIRPRHAMANSYTRNKLKPVFEFFAFYAVLLLNLSRLLYFE
jgi:hypothetical protein